MPDDDGHSLLPTSSSKPKLYLLHFHKTPSCCCLIPNSYLLLWIYSLFWVVQLPCCWVRLLHRLLAQKPLLEESTWMMWHYLPWLQSMLHLQMPWGSLCPCQPHSPPCQQCNWQFWLLPGNKNAILLISLVEDEPWWFHVAAAAPVLNDYQRGVSYYTLFMSECHILFENRWVCHSNSS